MRCFSKVGAPTTGSRAGNHNLLSSPHISTALAAYGSRRNASTSAALTVERNGELEASLSADVRFRSTRLYVVHPELVDEWVPEMNEVDVTSVTSASTKAAVWRCALCGHVYTLSPRRRVQLGAYACPRCHGAGQVPPHLTTTPLFESAPSSDDTTTHGGIGVAGSFAAAYPHLVKFWDTERNGALSPYQVPSNSTMTIWWRGPGNDRMGSDSSVEERFQRPLSAFVADSVSPKRKLAAKAALEEALLAEIRQVSSPALSEEATRGHDTTSTEMSGEVLLPAQPLEQEYDVSVEECRAFLQRDWHSMIEGIREEVQAYHDQQNAVFRMVEEVRLGDQEDVEFNEGGRLGEERRGGETPSSSSVNQGHGGNSSSSSKATERMGGSRYLPHTVLSTELGPHSRSFFLFSRTSRSVLPSFRSTSVAPSSSASTTMSERRYQERCLVEQAARDLELLLRIQDAHERSLSASSPGRLPNPLEPALLAAETWTRFFDASAPLATDLGMMSSHFSDTSATPPPAQVAAGSARSSRLDDLESSASPSASASASTFHVQRFGQSATLQIGDEPPAPPEIFPSSVRVPFPMPPAAAATSSDDPDEYTSTSSSRQEGSPAPPPGPSTEPLSYPKAPRRMPVIPEEDVLAATPTRGGDLDHADPFAPPPRSRDLPQHLAPRSSRPAPSPVETVGEDEEVEQASFDDAYQQEVTDTKGSHAGSEESTPHKAGGQAPDGSSFGSPSQDGAGPQRHPVYDRPAPEPRRTNRFQSNSFRLRLPRGNPSGRPTTDSTARVSSPPSSSSSQHQEGLHRSSSSASSGNGKLDGQAANAASPTPTLQAPRTPRKVARPKRVAAPEASPSE